VLPELTPDGSDLVLTFRILEGEARVIGPVTITGLRRTREWLVRGQVDVATGDPLDPRKLSEIERRLLELGVFSRAVVTTEAGNPAPIKIEVQEAAPYKLGYDLRYNTSDGGSGLVDAEVGNLFGTGLTLGGRVRAGRELRDTRAWIHLPSLWKLGDLTATAFRLREILAQEVPPVPPDVLTEPTVSIQKGIQGQFAVHSLHPVELLYGYRFKQSTITSPIFAFPISPRVAGLNASVVLNTRGNILDPIVGQFYSLALSYDDSLLGSDFSFIKGFGQAFFNHLIKQRVTWAQGYRLGLAWGLHGDRVPGFTPEFSERFKAGGSNSVRGFETDGLGPVDAFGDQVGGEAVLVINQELRLQGTSTLGAAIFYDVGNVYAQVQDFNLSLRQSLGVGLRYQSPIGLLRFDVGFPLNRRPEERRYQIWFGLGQAF
jgi:translocation and assembly module TamA